MKASNENGQLAYQTFKKIMVIQIMAVVSALLGSLVDGVVTGSFLGTQAMAAFGLCSPLVIIIATISGVFASGGQLICGKAMGRGDRSMVNRVFSVVILALAVIGAGVMLLMLFLPGPLAGVLGAKGENLPLVRDYIKGLAVGLIPMLITSAMSPFMQLDGDSLRSFIAVLIMTVANIGMDLLNVLVFQGGMFGMALATSISYFCSLVVLGLHFTKKASTILFVPKEIHGEDLKEIVLQGLPNATTRASQVVRALLLNRMVFALAGSTALAALTVQNTLSSLLSSVNIGIGMTTLVVGSVVYGEEDKAALVYLMKAIFKLSIVLTAVISVFSFLFSGTLVSWFGDNPEALALSNQVVRIWTLSMIFCVINAVFMYFFQFTARRNLANIVSILDNVVLMIGFAFLMSRFMGIEGVWWAFVVSSFCLVLVIYGIACWKHGGPVKSMEELLMLEKGYGVDREHCISLAVRNREDVMKLSVQIAEFCKRWQIDERRTFVSSLCMEEMAGNIVQHGFGDGKKHLIEVYLLYKDGALSLRLKDDCKAFNPREQMENFYPEDKAKNIGIRMIASMTQEMEYHNTMHMNVLTIKI